MTKHVVLPPSYNTAATASSDFDQYEKNALLFHRPAIAAHFALLHQAARRANIEGGKLVLSIVGQDPDTKEEFAKARSPRSRARRLNAIRFHDPIIPSTPLDDIYSKEASRGECSIAALFPIVAPTRPAGAN